MQNHNIKLKTALYLLTAFFVFSFLFLFSGEARAATYYVCLSGCDYSTIQRAVDAVSGGDIVYVREGSYAGFQFRNVNGSPEAPIVIREYPGERVIIDRNLGTGDGFRIIYFGDSSYIVLDGFEITDTHSSIDASRDLDPSNPADLDAIIDVARRQVIKVDNSQYLTFQNIDVYHVAGTPIFTSSEEGVQYVQILDSQFHTGFNPSTSYGVYLRGRYFTVRGNRFYNNTGHGIRLGTGPGNRFSDSVVENNIIFDNGGGLILHRSSGRLFNGGAGIMLWRGRNNIVRNNVIYMTGEYKSRYPLPSGSREFEGTGINVTDRNNIVVNNTIFNMANRGIYVRDSDNTIDNAITNNIAYSNGGEDLDIASERGNVIDRNLAGVNPIFVDAANNDFRLSLQSPAIDSGTSLNAPSEDILGAPRPQGSGYDIGAYEYGSTPSPSILPPPTYNLTSPSVTNPATDTIPPSIPTLLSARVLSSSRVYLSWRASTDNVRVVRYNIYRNESEVGSIDTGVDLIPTYYTYTAPGGAELSGAVITSITSTTYFDSGLAHGVTYTYTVSALDAAGNESSQSAAVSATTPMAIALGHSSSLSSSDPPLSAEENPPEGSLVPCAGTGTGTSCNLCYLLALTNNIITFFVYFAVTVATLMFVYAGFKYITASGDPAKISSAHKIFWNVFIGFIFVLAAWLIVDTVMKTFLPDGEIQLGSESKFGPWNEITCK